MRRSTCAGWVRGPRSWPWRTVATGLLGLALAAAGTAALFPTPLGVLTAQVPDRTRGTATSVVTTGAYLGYLAGPVYVGLCGDAVRLPVAMLALAALGAVLAALAPLVLHHLTRRRPATDAVKTATTADSHTTQ